MAATLKRKEIDKKKKERKKGEKEFKINKK